MAMNWKRCSKQWRSRNVESKYGEDVVLKNGARTPTAYKDMLAHRAEAEMERWLSLLPKKKRQRLAAALKAAG